MDLLTLFLGVLLAGLSAILAAIGGVTAARFRDVRLAAVSAALALLAAVGLLTVLHEVSPRYGGPFAVAPWPLGVLVLAVAFLYAAIVRGAPRRPPE